MNLIFLRWRRIRTEFQLDGLRATRRAETAFVAPERRPFICITIGQ